MPFKKGMKKIEGSGRKIGSVNKVQSEVKAGIEAFLIHGQAKFEELFDKVAKKNPGRAIEILNKYTDFVLPRLQRTQVIDERAPKKVIVLPDNGENAVESNA